MIINIKNKIQNYMNILFIILFSSIALQSCLSLYVVAKPVIGFDPGRIIDDVVFVNSNSMSKDQIQTFLNSKIPSCDTNGTQPATDFGRPDLTHAQYAASRGWPAPPYTCLKDYVENSLSAAQIIYNLAQQYKINPQVLIVLLQKEQGLVTDTWPLSVQYRSATGYGCPDTAPCDSQYYGLTNQLTWSSIMFRSIFNNSPTWYTPYILGDNYIQWSPNSACGGTNIYIQNRATQSLYNYTPYQPNQSALDAGYGTGDSCGSYGNRNFYLYFSDWFGSTKVDDTLNPHPDGTLVSIGTGVFLIQNGSLRHIVNGAIFESNDYKWQDIKPGTTGDKNLTITSPIDNIRQGTLFVGDETGVYTSIFEDGQWVKQLISYNSFINLGYSWSQIHFIQKAELPSITSKTILTSLRHPDGTLIKNSNGVFLLDNGTKRYVSASVFASYKWQWNDIVPESIDDQLIPIGQDIAFREGTIISEGSNLYVIKSLISGLEIKNPIGPWECYANIYKYNSNDIIQIISESTPLQVGPRISC